MHKDFASNYPSNHQRRESSKTFKEQGLNNQVNETMENAMQQENKHLKYMHRDETDHKQKNLLQMFNISE